jgi:hypothetical protein
VVRIDAASAAWVISAYAVALAVLTAVHGRIADIVALGVTTLLFLAGAGVDAAVVGGLGEVLGLSGALIALVLLPIAGTLVMLRQLRVAALVNVEVPAR